MSIRIIIGDVREKLAELPDESVHCVVTSPPYFGLRDYGSCDCGSGRFDLGQGEGTGGNLNYRPAQAFKDECAKCGGTGRIKGTERQIGLEPTPAEFVAVMVEVFREVRRVLRKDGTLWLNLGDSYASGGRGGGGSYMAERKDAAWQSRGDATGWRSPPEGLKHKDLMGIPWRVAFALQADGWYLRQDIIWSKPNPMPESVTDRCTKAHEYLFLLSKSARYHYDAEAIAEDAVKAGQVLHSYGTGAKDRAGASDVNDNRTKIGLANWDQPCPETRNRRSVWTVATQPFKEAHFATFPPDLIEPCIKAGCPKDCCAKCGAPVVRELSAPSGGATGQSWHDHSRDMEAGNAKTLSSAGYIPRQTTGWSPSCSCDAGLVRGTVLDPFGGAGTTGLVADRLQRDAILIELNPEYMAMAEERIKDDAPLFAVLT